MAVEEMNGNTRVGGGAVGKGRGGSVGSWEGWVGAGNKVSRRQKPRPTARDAGRGACGQGRLCVGNVQSGRCTVMNSVLRISHMCLVLFVLLSLACLRSVGP